MLLNACALLQQQAQTDNALHNLLVRSAATSCTAVAAVPAIHAACTARHQMVHKSNDMSKLQKRQGAENTSSDARHWRTEPGYTAALHASSMMLSRHCQQMACTCCLLTIVTPSTQKTVQNQQPHAGHLPPKGRLQWHPTLWHPSSACHHEHDSCYRTRTWQALTLPFAAPPPMYACLVTPVRGTSAVRPARTSPPTGGSLNNSHAVPKHI